MMFASVHSSFALLLMTQRVPSAFYHVFVCMYARTLYIVCGREDETVGNFKHLNFHVRHASS